MAFNKLAAVLLCVVLSSAEGFFLYGNSNNAAPKKKADIRAGGQWTGYTAGTKDGQVPSVSYSTAWLPPQYSFDSPVTVTLIPVQTQEKGWRTVWVTADEAQMAPSNSPQAPNGPQPTLLQAAAVPLQGTLHNLQLHPCLCPIPKETNVDPGVAPPPAYVAAPAQPTNS